MHFLLLGVVLFTLQGFLFPAPKPVVGPLDDARVATLVQTWQGFNTRAPDASERQRLLRSELERDMLFQHAISLELYLHDPVVQQRLVRNMRFLGLAAEADTEALFERALELRLHLGDEVIKRRMLQVMEQLLLASSPPAVITEAEIVAAFQQRSGELRRSARYSIVQLFFDRNREAEVPGLIARIEQEALPPQDAVMLSSPFMQGYTFTAQTPDQLARRFGAVFVSNFLATVSEPRRWYGPVRSTYGLHYVWVDDIEPARDATLAEVRPILQRDLESEARSIALAQAITRLSERYELRL
ncbi:peptidylprolyl isomerase [Kineobactrum sediminis]|uniref:peptidylprolyl isomerase n=1 Tax=Kineobactrum sediminis TaxID=1905677 RepID=UPI001F4E2384|nr:peptidylprolyl isomerase [Kineobactrum sediminis]